MRFSLPIILVLTGILSGCGETVTINDKAPATTNSEPGTFSENGQGEFNDLQGVDGAALSAILGNYCGTLHKTANSISQTQSFTMSIANQTLTNNTGQSAQYAVMSLNSTGQIGTVQITQPMGLTLNDIYNSYGFITPTITNTTLRPAAFKIALEISLSNQYVMQPQNSHFILRDCAYSSTVCLTDASDVTVSDFHKCD